MNFEAPRTMRGASRARSGERKASKRTFLCIDPFLPALHPHGSGLAGRRSTCRSKLESQSGQSLQYIPHLNSSQTLQILALEKFFLRTGCTVDLPSDHHNLLSSRRPDLVIRGAEKGDRRKPQSSSHMGDPRIVSDEETTPLHDRGKGKEGESSCQNGCGCF